MDFMADLPFFLCIILFSGLVWGIYGEVLAWYILILKLLEYVVFGLAGYEVKHFITILINIVTHLSLIYVMFQLLAMGSTGEPIAPS
mmetsp:Transcript_2732/g.2585  ORF Transcript_2732/g.2585 Transcript_2732/m.2585 type:complete len:87 (+) Transcript_2732:276-536(+)